MTVNSYPMSAKISRRAGDDDPSMIFRRRGDAQARNLVERLISTRFSSSSILMRREGRTLKRGDLPEMEAAMLACLVAACSGGLGAAELFEWCVASLIAKACSDSLALEYSYEGGLSSVDHR